MRLVHVHRSLHLYQQVSIRCLLVSQPALTHGSALWLVLNAPRCLVLTVLVCPSHCYVPLLQFTPQGMARRMGRERM